MKQIRTQMLTILLLPVIWMGSELRAAEVLDQEFDATGGGASLAVTAVSSLAQTFTVGEKGVLSRVSLMLGRREGAQGDFTLLILPTTEQGFTDGFADPLFSQTYPVSYVTVIGSFEYKYTSFDVSSANIAVSHGDLLAIALVRASVGSDDWLLWEAFATSAIPTYDRGSAYIDRSGGSEYWEYIDNIDDLGFQSFVNVSPPSAAVILWLLQQQSLVEE